MPKYRLTVAYDGTAYAGWQAQEGHHTIEGTLKRVFVSIFDRDVSLLVASRTDAGVHAAGNIVRLETSVDVEEKKLCFALNNILPNDIIVRSVERVDTFHPFYDVIEKCYHYHLFDHKPLPFFARYGWFVRSGWDVGKLQAVLDLYHGTYDFSQFSTSCDTRQDKVRTIDVAIYEKSDLFPAHRIVIVGKKFLHSMVRRMVGTAIYVATKRDAKVEIVERMLKEQRQTDYRLKAPAHGLLLHSVIYNHMKK